MPHERVELIAGVCPIIYRESEPTKVLVVPELTAKEVTGKFSRMWGLGYETVEEGESHWETIRRFFIEEVRAREGEIVLPLDLEPTKIAIIRISPPEMAAWVHAYPCPVPDSFEARRGNFVDEVGAPVWLDTQAILGEEQGPNRMIFRAGTYELVRAFENRLAHPTDNTVAIIPTPINLPDWRVYRLIEQGFSQTEALSQLGIDPQPLLSSWERVRSLSQQEAPRNIS